MVSIFFKHIDGFNIKFYHLRTNEEKIEGKSVEEIKKWIESEILGSGYISWLIISDKWLATLGEFLNLEGD